MLSNPFISLPLVVNIHETGFVLDLFTLGLYAIGGLEKDAI